MPHETELEAHILARGYERDRGVLCQVADGRTEKTTEANQSAFGEKWKKVVGHDDLAPVEAFHRAWYLKLYGFSDEEALRSFVARQKVILDAGAGYGFKSAYLASLSPDTLVVSMDLSESIYLAAERYGDVQNIIFVRGDIASTPLPDGSVDFVSCDQVLHHTIDPAATLAEFSRVLVHGGHAALYVYAKKALPRELLDEHFISGRAQLDHDAVWQMSRKLTELGRMLEETNLELDFPDIPELGVTGGRQSLQRFVYYNFIKCFWNEDMGFDASVSTNFDWYAPSIAYRFSQDEFEELVRNAGFGATYLHSEKACHSGMFTKGDALAN